MQSRQTETTSLHPGNNKNCKQPACKFSQFVKQEYKISLTPLLYHGNHTPSTPKIGKSLNNPPKFCPDNPVNLQNKSYHTKLFYLYKFFKRILFHQILLIPQPPNFTVTDAPLSNSPAHGSHGGVRIKNPSTSYSDTPHNPHKSPSPIHYPD